MRVKGIQVTLKRILDILAGFAGVVIMTPVMVVIATIIWLKLGSPVLFRQKRLGRNGIPFVIRKFRTMTDKRDKFGNLLPDAQRVTRFGRVLRRTRLDELPELATIISGEMSLVGPRPLLESSFVEMDAFERVRFSARPGLTGWSQVNGNTLLTLGEKAALDIWYLNHWSLKLDMVILWRTLGVVLFGEIRNEKNIAEAVEYATRINRSG